MPDNEDDVWTPSEADGEATRGNLHALLHLLAREVVRRLKQSSDNADRPGDQVAGVIQQVSSQKVVANH
jgi:hypothetical protein